MAQFYNDKIEMGISQLSLFLENKDLELNKLIYDIFIKYTKNQKIISQIDFNKNFDKIYNINKIDVIDVFENQNNKNLSRTQKEFLNAGYEKKTIEKNYNNIEKANEELVLQINQLKNNSYFKYKEICFYYQNELNSKLIGE